MEKEVGDLISRSNSFCITWGLYQIPDSLSVSSMIILKVDFGCFLFGKNPRKIMQLPMLTKNVGFVNALFIKLH